MIRLCKGCQRLEFIVCLFRHWGDTHECPCKDCLIKMICVNECDDRMEAITNLLDGLDMNVEG